MREGNKMSHVTGMDDDLMNGKYGIDNPCQKLDNPFIEAPENKSFGKKALDGVKYAAKNFWKALPVGSLVNHENKNLKNMKDGKYSFIHTLFQCIKSCLQHGFNILRIMDT